MRCLMLVTRREWDILRMVARVQFMVVSVGTVIARFGLVAVVVKGVDLAVILAQRKWLKVRVGSDDRVERGFVVRDWLWRWWLWSWP